LALVPFWSHLVPVVIVVNDDRVSRVRKRRRRAHVVEGDYVCSFCGKRQGQCARMIAGPDVAICNECVALCVEILLGELRAIKPTQSAREGPG
jgi:hypothetical protein